MRQVCGHGIGQRLWYGGAVSVHVADDDRHGSQASQFTGVFASVARDDFVAAFLPGGRQAQVG